MNWILGHKLQWICYQNLYILIQENVFENVVKKLWPFVLASMCKGISHQKQLNSLCNRMFRLTTETIKVWHSWVFVMRFHWKLCSITKDQQCCNHNSIFVNCRPHYINSSLHSDIIWQHTSWSTLAQVIACCVMALSHYLNQCELLIREVLLKKCRPKVLILVLNL